MTAIAKYALIRGGRATILHNNLGAYDVLNLSMAGPDLTVRYLDAYHDAYGRAADWGGEPEGWDMAAEGGLLVDQDRQTMLVFTIYTNVAERAAYFATVAHAWPGWRVEWAYDGIADLMRHAGDGPSVDDVEYRADPDDLELGHRVYGQYGSPKSVCRYLVTVAAADGRTTAHSVTYPKPWWVGEPLLGALGEESLVDSCPTMPEAGLHLDLRTHDAWLWTCNRPLNGIREHWHTLWPGWRLTFCEGRYAEQLDRCAGVVAVPLPSALAGFESLREGATIHWGSYVADYPSRARGYRAQEAIGRLMALTPAEIDAVLALIQPSDG